MRLRAYRPILLFLVVLCCGGISQAQDPETGLYRSFFGEDTTVWNVCRWYVDDLNFDETYVFAGDTLVDDTMICKNIYCKSQWSRRLEDGTWYDYDTLIWYGNIREDRTTGRLWYKARQPYWELIADMSLSMEDSFEGYRVRGIVMDSLGRKVILFNNRNPFIEGVGPIDFGEYKEYTLVCVSHDDISQFSMDLSNGIFTRWLSEYYTVVNCKLYRTVGISERKLSSVSIYPNPCEDWFMVEGGNGISIRLYDLKGNLVIENAGARERIHTDGLASGVYILQIEGNEYATTRKLIKR